MNLSLYQLSTEYREACEKLCDLDLDETTLRDTLEAMSGDLEEKAQNTGMLVRNLEATAASIKDAEAQMARRRKALENRAASVRTYLLDSMQFAGIHRIESPHFVLAVRENPAAVEVYEPGLIPPQFMRQPEPPPATPDKTAIKEALKAGQDVPGCKLTRGVRLEIK